MSAVTAVVVAWHARSFLPRCLEALAQQTARPHIIVVDNASTDGSADLLRSDYPQVELLALDQNLGYAGGANRGLAAARADYVMVLNPDIALAPNHLEVLARRLNADPAIGAAQGKLYATSPAAFVAGAFDSARLDSAGHRIAPTRMVYDRGQGEPDGPAYDEERSVFSACGAALFLRRAMLDDIAPEGRFFADSFFAYKEDIDLCWRARLRGWDVRYIPEAVAHHVRGWAGTAARPSGPGSRTARDHSWQNHYRLLLRNETGPNLLRALPAVLAWELLRQGHALLRDRALFRTYPALLRALPAILAERREIMRGRRVSDAEMRRWFGSDGEVI